MNSIKGYVEKIIFRNQQNGYTVLSVEEDEGSIVCVGSFSDISAGEFMEFTGEFVLHPKFGQQFQVSTFRVVLPEDPAAVERYLGSGAIKGIGAVTARRIVERFGDDTLRILDEEPERLAEIKGISRKKAQEIAAAQEEKKDMRNAMIFLGEYGITNALSVKLYGLYGQDIYTIIRDNPYQLADEVTGIGFRRADEIAQRAGINPGSDFRIKACMIYSLQHALDNGHVYLPEPVLKKQVMETLQPRTVDGLCEIEEADLLRCMNDLAIESRIIIKKPVVINGDSARALCENPLEQQPENFRINRDSARAFCENSREIVENPNERENLPAAEDRQIYYSRNYYTELGIARMMVNLNLKTDPDNDAIRRRIREVEQASGIVLDEMQKYAVQASASCGVLIITGGPGTGKTTTINALIRYFEEDHREILLAAPTGRAAKRMTEATGHEAKTIHRMLELSAELEDTSAGARFNRNEDCPLEADVVIVDEASMIDIFLMSALLRAIAPGTRLILVGDVDQLPSVGPGNILKDLIDSGCFPTVKLVRIFRQAEESEIVMNAHRINKGEQISLRTDSRDFIFLKREHPQAVASAVLTLFRDKLPAYVHTDLREIQILSPMKRGPLGVLQLNRFLQEAVNPGVPGKKELPVRDMIFREGDKVMHIKNNYDLAWEMRTATGFAYDRGTGIFNGDIGIISRINEQNHLLEVIFDDGKYVVYEQEQLEELTLAYATTIHKAQGSEYPAVVLPLLSGPDILMNRNILYTAVTRARKCVVIVGSAETVQRMIRNTREQERYTGLKDRLAEIARERSDTFLK